MLRSARREAGRPLYCRECTAPITVKLDDAGTAERADDGRVIVRNADNDELHPCYTRKPSGDVPAEEETTMELSRNQRERLVRVCSEFSSDSSETRARAARDATKLLHDAGGSWAEALRPVRAASPAPDDDPLDAEHRRMVDLCREHRDRLDDWSISFLGSVSTQRYPLTPRQAEVLAKIAAKFEERPRAPREEVKR